VLAAGAGEQQEFQLELCRRRPLHWRNNQHNYLHSSLLDGGAGRLDWEAARTFCRQRCMDLVSLETGWEDGYLRRRLTEAGLSLTTAWTSGHLCDRAVSERCFTEPDLQPRRVRGWFWSGSSTRLAPTDSTPAGWSRNPWTEVGPSQHSCLALTSAGWDSRDCTAALDWVCEDSTDLLTAAGINKPIIFG